MRHHFVASEVLMGLGFNPHHSLGFNPNLGINPHPNGIVTSRALMLLYSMPALLCIDHVSSKTQYTECALHSDLWIIHCLTSICRSHNQPDLPSGAFTDFKSVMCFTAASCFCRQHLFVLHHQRLFVILAMQTSSIRQVMPTSF